MEDKKSLNAISLYAQALKITLSILVLFSPWRIFAYEVGTHAFLTNELVDFYNQQSSERPIPDEFKKFIVEGSIREDDSVRWMNHFYDPIYNRGLTKLPGNWLSSKAWAQSSDAQVSGLYNPIVNTTIADLLALTNPAALRETDFTWERAIKDYVRGDYERAFRGLGQVLHLIEDASVPDHTRNDSHPAFNHEDTLETGSPYEIWTGNFTLDTPDKGLKARLANKKQIMRDSLDAYFDAMALYSNNNFYSKDTIGIGEYKSPEPDYDYKIGKYFYPTRTDKEFGDYALFRKSVPDLLINNESDITLQDDFVLDGYWHRLSVKAVQHGAGVIDLFFKEIEKAKNDPNFVKDEPKSFFAQVVDVLRGWVDGATSLFKSEENNNLKLVSEIQLEQKEGNQIVEGDVLQQSKTEEENTTEEREALVLVDNQDEDAVEREAQKLKEQATSTLPVIEEASMENSLSSKEVVVKACTFNTDKTATRQKLILNEVAWMGGQVSANDEWLELKNISGSELDVSGWQILDKDEQIKIALAKGTKVPANGFLLLERTDDNSVPVLLANAVYAGAMSNSNEGLRLFDNECNLIDEVLANSSWPAGESNSRRTMERNSDFTWHTYTGNGMSLDGVLIMGTPKNENSQATAVVKSGGDSTSQSAQPAASASVNHVVISEVQVAGADAGDEFIELYNPTDAEVDLSGWSLQYVSGTATSTEGASKKNFDSGNKISAKGFFLIAREKNGSNADGYTGSTAADLAHRTFSLSGSATGAKIFLVHNQEKITSFDDADVVDKLDYSFSVPAAGQSLERKAYQNNACVLAQGSGEFYGNGCDTNSDQSDFEIRGMSKPQNTQSLPEPRTAPTTVSSLNAEYATSLGVRFNWAEAQDVAGATSTIKYLLSYATSSPELRTFATLDATTTYQSILNEIGIGYTFGIVAQDKDGLSSATTTAALSIPTQFSRVYFYKDIRTASSTKYLVEFYYGAYPFVQDLYWTPAQSTWKILVFYLNREAPDEIELNTANNWQPSDPTGVLDFAYANCASGSPTRFSVILPDIESQCNNGGGVANSALQFGNLEDLHLLLELATTTTSVTFSGQDFLSVGTYSLYDAGGGSQRFKRAALDRTKYYFQLATPIHQNPSIPDNVEVKAQSNSSILRVIWDRAEDADSIDNELTYEINYSTSTLAESGWITAPSANLDPGEGSEVNGRPFTKVGVEPNNTYQIALRAKDDFGNVSAAATTTFFVPDVTPPYGMANIRWGYVNSSSTPEVSFDANAYPFMTVNKASAIIFFLNQSPPVNYSFLNSVERWEIGGAHTVLKLQYSTCTNANDSLLGGLLMHNSSSCPNGGNGLKKNSVRNNLVTGQTTFITGISGVLANGGSTSHVFSESDYVTIGFYELQGSAFQEVATYNKKIYFQPF